MLLLNILSSWKQNMYVTGTSIKLLVISDFILQYLTPSPFPTSNLISFFAEIMLNVMASKSVEVKSQGFLRFFFSIFIFIIFF